VVPPGNGPELAKAVLAIRDLSETARQTMAKKSRQYYDENFARGLRIDRLEEILTQLTSPPQ
jgi:glycosyltransferase involved in cell wall biosynthesis